MQALTLNLHSPENDALLIFALIPANGSICKPWGYKHSLLYYNSHCSSSSVPNSWVFPVAQFYLVEGQKQSGEEEAIPSKFPRLQTSLGRMAVSWRLSGHPSNDI